MCWFQGQPMRAEAGGRRRAPGPPTPNTQHRSSSSRRSPYPWPPEGVPEHPRRMRVVTRFGPHMYRPGGRPLYWGHDVSGVLVAAVHAYLACQTNQGPEPSAEDLEILIDYLRHYACAPCWHETARDWPEFEAALVTLRLEICEGYVETPDEIHDWLLRLLDYGLDPL